MAKTLTQRTTSLLAAQCSDIAYPSPLTQAKEAVRQGKHRSASRFVVVAYGRRLLAANRLLRWADQSTFLYLLGDFQPAAELPRVVDEMCGIKYIFMRFWKQYDVSAKCRAWAQ